MAKTEGTKRSHKATFARDKKKGGYLIRVAGPRASEFAGREVPVTRMNDSESFETLEKLIWSGVDAESGGNVALYTFKARPAEDIPQVDF